MRLAFVSIVSLPVLILANDAVPSTRSLAATPSFETATPSEPTNTGLATIQTASPNVALGSISDLDEVQQEELRKRQNQGQVVGITAATVATQVSPVTTYLAYGPDGIQSPVTFTQLFSTPLDQWDAPASGSIGLGSITGQIGVVKTNSKRNLAAEATAAVKQRFDSRIMPRAENASTNSGDALIGPARVLAVWVGFLGVASVIMATL